MNIFITGIGGFIGTALAKAHRNAGDRVVGLIRSSKDYNYALHSVEERFIGDITEYDHLCDIISSREIDRIYHLAACSVVRVCAQDPLTAYRTNALGTATILEAARNVGTVKSIVCASSDKAYGDSEAPYVEGLTPLDPSNTYDTSKACGDMIARAYAKNYNMPIVVTRACNVYGPGDPNQSRLIPNTIQRLLNNQAPQIYSDVSSMVREFVYIDDVVRAYRLLGDYNGLGSLCSRAFNIAGSGPVVIGALVEQLIDIVGVDIVPEVIKRDSKFKEIKAQWLSNKNTFVETNYKPEIGLREGLEKTVAWYRGL